MAIAEINEYVKMLATVKGTPHRYLWSSYDAEAMCFTSTSKSPATPPTAR